MPDETVTGWQPSESQSALASHMMAHDYDVTIDSACNAVGISRQTYYRWMENEDYAEWWNTKRRRHFAARLSIVHAKVYKAAVTEYKGGKDPDPKPDAALMKLALEVFDDNYQPGSRVKHSGEVAHKVDATVEVKLDDEFRRWAAAETTPVTGTTPVDKGTDPASQPQPVDTPKAD